MALPFNIVHDFPPIENGILELSHSSVKLGGSCARKLEFRKFHKSSRSQEGLAADVGHAMHHGTQSFLTDYDQEKAFAAMIMDYPMQWDKGPMDQRSLEACYGMLKKAMSWPHLTEYELARIEDPNGESRPAVEVPFILRIKDFPWYPNGDSIQIDYLGFIDLIMRHKPTAEHQVWDIKSTTKNADMDVIYRFDDQCLPYGLVLEALLNQDYRNGFTYAYWTQYIHPLNAENRFHSYTRGESDVQEWIKKYLFFLYEFKTYYNMGWFPRAGGNSCYSWNRPCQYVDICEHRDPDFLNAMIQKENANLPEMLRPEPWIVIDLDVEITA